MCHQLNVDIPFIVQVSAMRPSWLFLCWTSTTLWFWPGACTTCSSAFSQSSPGQAATTNGTQKTAWRIPSARTRHSGGLQMPLTSLLLSPSSGSKYWVQICCALWKPFKSRKVFVKIALFIRTVVLSHSQRLWCSFSLLVTFSISILWNLHNV